MTVMVDEKRAARPAAKPASASTMSTELEPNGTNWNQIRQLGARKLLNNGGQGRNRTADASLFRAALYQLSYLATRGPRQKGSQFVGTSELYQTALGLQSAGLVSTFSTRVVPSKCATRELTDLHFATRAR